MRHTEFWARMERHLGSAYAETWARMTVVPGLEGRTASQALDAGVAPKEVWTHVWRMLELPDSER